MPADWYRTLLVYAVLFAVGLLGAVSDAILNQWARTSKLWWLMAAYLSWVGVATLLGLILKWRYFTFSGAIVLFLVVNSAGAILLDYKVFGGRLTLWEWVGIALAVVAMCCIEMGRAKSHVASAMAEQAEVTSKQ